MINNSNNFISASSFFSSLSYLYFCFIIIKSIFIFQFFTVKQFPYQPPASFHYLKSKCFSLLSSLLLFCSHLPLSPAQSSAMKERASNLSAQLSKSQTRVAFAVSTPSSTETNSPNYHQMSEASTSLESSPRSISPFL
jgi:hypothetical protein